MLDDDAYLDMVFWRMFMMLHPHFMDDATHRLEDIGALMMSVDHMMNCTLLDTFHHTSYHGRSTFEPVYCTYELDVLLGESMEPLDDVAPFRGH
jgi:hypothetical protein